MRDENGKPFEGRITMKQAKKLLPPRVQNIHTFVPTRVGLVGATWKRKQVVSLMEKHSDGVHLSGPRMRAMKHGVVVLRPEKNPVFIETNADRLEEHFPTAKLYSNDDYENSGMPVPEEVTDGET